MERLSYLTVAYMDNKLAKAMGAMLKTQYIRTTISNDIMGTEYASMLKNIYAIAWGIAHALGYGDNFQSDHHCQGNNARISHYERSPSNIARRSVLKVLGKIVYWEETSLHAHNACNSFIAWDKSYTYFICV